MVIKGDFDFGNLVHWVLDDLEIAPDADFSISEERAKELLAGLRESDASYFGDARDGLIRDGIGGTRFLGRGRSECRVV